MLNFFNVNNFKWASERYKDEILHQYTDVSKFFRRAFDTMYLPIHNDLFVNVNKKINGGYSVHWRFDYMKDISDFESDGTTEGSITGIKHYSTDRFESYTNACMAEIYNHIQRAIKSAVDKES